MSHLLKIAIIGDYNFTLNSHHATNISIDHSANFLELEVNYYWIRVSEAV
jgi:CTP synthase (UTP-ammonia lyase)